MKRYIFNTTFRKLAYGLFVFWLTLVIFNTALRLLLWVVT